MSELTVQVTPGYQLSSSEVLTPTILNLIATPTVTLVGLVGASVLGPNAVATSAIVDHAVTPVKLDAAVAGDGLVYDEVTGLAVNPDGVTLEVDADALTLMDGAVSAAKMATDAVETTSIKNLNVTTGKLADGAVTAAKLAATALAGTARIKISTYAGAAAGSVVVTGVGFMPDLLLVCDQAKHETLLALRQEVSKKFHKFWIDGALDNILLTSWDADGFTLAADQADVSKNGNTYSYVAVKIA